MLKIAKQVFQCATIAIFLAGLGAQSKAPLELAIIANPKLNLDEMTIAELKSVYLGNKTSLNDGTPLKPILEKGGPAHSAFLKEYLGKSDMALMTYYRSLVFSGKWSMPTTLRSDSDMVAYVAKNPDAIGYALPSAVTSGVKVLRIR